MERIVKKILALTLAGLLAGPMLVAAQEPLQAIKVPIERAIVILKDPLYRDPDNKAIQREKLWEIIQEIFDFKLIAKRTVGRYHWRNTFSQQQQKEFTDVFGEFLANTYLTRIRGTYDDISVEYVGQEINASKPIAKVKTKIIRKNENVLIDYSLRLRNGTWKIYDVFAEGVSLVQNYQTQIRGILSKESPDQLIDKLNAKIAEQRKQRAGSE